MVPSPRVLVVDDEVPVQNQLSVGLAQRGFEVELSEHGVSALEKLAAARRRGNPHHYIVLDIRLPDIDGLNLLQIERGRFRRDLYYRLNISSVFLPPLRERREDVELLAYYFLDIFSKRNDKMIDSISDEVMYILEVHDYPGNVRELENIIAGAVVLESSGTLTKSSLPPYLTKVLDGSEVLVPWDVQRTLAELEAEHIQRVLGHTDGNRTAAAQILGVSRVGLLGKMKKHGIEVEHQPRGIIRSRNARHMGRE